MPVNPVRLANASGTEDGSRNGTSANVSPASWVIVLVSWSLFYATMKARTLTIGSVKSSAPSLGTRPAISETATITTAEIRAFTTSQNILLASLCPWATSAKWPEQDVSSISPLLLAERKATQAVAAAVVFDCVERAGEDESVNLGFCLGKLRLGRDVLQIGVKVRSSRN